eukprot:scaffold1850_cov194-Pinguiococcus_pyrenoidosus.AAC.65
MMLTAKTSHASGNAFSKVRPAATRNSAQRTWRSIGSRSQRLGGGSRLRTTSTSCLTGGVA